MVCHNLNSGQVKSVKPALKQLQQSIQNITQLSEQGELKKDFVCKALWNYPPLLHRLSKGIQVWVVVLDYMTLNCHAEHCKISFHILALHSLQGNETNMWYWFHAIKYSAAEFDCLDKLEKKYNPVSWEQCCSCSSRGHPKQQQWDVCMVAAGTTVRPCLPRLCHALHAGRLHGESTEIYRQSSASDRQT